MRIRFADSAIDAAKNISPNVRKAFEKQLRFLVANLNHPSLHAKKYSQTENKWQARVNRDWRFYFRIEGDTFVILDVIPHPK